jgi:hypothetical protein
MTNTISMDAARRIWTAHREIEVGKKLLADIKAALDRRDDATPIDPFGRRRNYTLGVPSGDNAHRMLDVSPRLAACIIEAHIAEKQRELVEASIAASIELDGAVLATKQPWHHQV